MQTLLGGPGNISLEDQALGIFVNVDRRRICLPRRFRRSVNCRRAAPTLGGSRPDADPNRRIGSTFITCQVLCSLCRDQTRRQAGVPRGSDRDSARLGVFRFRKTNGQNPVGE